MLREFVSPTSTLSSSQDLKIATGIGNILILSDNVTALMVDTESESASTWTQQ